ncbi:hypothetical protein [Candidatus Neoehrlichia procyonis]|uniref:Uncharacterized protein n=1 Tax=Candidatus Neoehrlichia procyonis str. RAC413 TaxID=1359163 RepID=A0A0F3NMR1_9RICK|nr:hypothetical protein [Candidatus Neoehrlichia lotoris]KJV68997.1 hypothetical protein NLO413_0370 [Candidatus Neoehrlichia lotoris str. RAC413]
MVLLLDTACFSWTCKLVSSKFIIKYRGTLSVNNPQAIGELMLHIRDKLYMRDKGKSSITFNICRTNIYTVPINYTHYSSYSIKELNSGIGKKIRSAPSFIARKVLSTVINKCNIRGYAPLYNKEISK